MANANTLQTRLARPNPRLLRKNSSLCVAEITTVFRSKGYCRAEIIFSPDGENTLIPVLPFTSMGQQGSSSGIIRIPEKGDLFLVARLGHDYYPICTVPVASFLQNRTGTKDLEGDNGKRQSRREKRETFEGHSEGPNFHDERRKLGEGNCAMLGADGLSGIILSKRRYARVFSSEECGREYGGDHKNEGDVPRIRDITIDYELNSTPCLFVFEELERGEKKKNGIKKTLANQEFYKNSKRREDIYFQITSGHHKESGKGSASSGEDSIIRTEAIREPDQNEQGKGNSSTKSVDPSGSACCDNGAQFDNGNEDFQAEDTTVKSKGISHNANYKKIYKQGGAVTTASKKKIEYQTRKDFLVFASERIGLLSSTSAFVHGKEKAAIIGLEEASISSEQVKVEVKDKVRITRESTSVDGGLPGPEEGVL